MASPSDLQSMCLCSICLNTFIDPVSTPCGHSFCKVCIDTHWDMSDAIQCPICQESFKKRPQLRVNITIIDLMNALKINGESIHEEEISTQTQDVLCDVCTGEKKAKALKSCLQCEESLCAEHLKPHQNDAELKRHELWDPVNKLKERVCKQHRKPLDLVCQCDLTCVCVLCIQSDHQDHNCVPLEGRLRKKKIKVEQALTKVQQKIKEREEMEKKVVRSVEISEKNASTDTEDTLRIFTRLQQVFELSQTRLLDTIPILQRKTEDHCKSVKEKLQQEIGELEKQRSELEQLSHIEDIEDLHLLQSLNSLCDPPTTKDWSEISAYSDPGVGILQSAVSQLLMTLHIAISYEQKRMVKNEIKRIQQYAVDVTLDPDTAHQVLILSEDGKQVRHGCIPQNLPDNPERFNALLGVLGKDGYSSGAFYFEVQVEDKAGWDIGVALETVDRKGNTDVSLSKGFCALMLRGEEFIACKQPPVRINRSKKGQKVGVFVDHEEGEVRFYDVENKTHIYSFTGMRFPKKKLHPYVNPCGIREGKNSAPMVITPVIQDI
ncbi:E3 ubiquitin-protein ligase TRIM39-like [Centroberyx affinis]|uniref:E3 ubiquitin-protein ligase TRIM39-like n=1 Tax=Centroberyx affinis TaxID=166261 RepID=UPI003A5BC39C